MRKNVTFHIWDSGSKMRKFEVTNRVGAVECADEERELLQLRGSIRIGTTERVRRARCVTRVDGWRSLGSGRSLLLCLGHDRANGED